MKSHFFAYMSRMKLIERWSLMRNIVSENIQEHSLNVAMTAHVLAMAANKYYGKNIDANYCATIALYHDVSEVVIGDLPTPVKYFNPEIKEAYSVIEDVAKEKLISLLPDDLQEEYAAIFSPSDQYIERIIKAADKICAYTKCIEETVAGNCDFKKAKEGTRKAIDKYMDMPEVKWFMETFIDSFHLTIDEMD